MSQGDHMYCFFFHAENAPDVQDPIKSFFHIIPFLFESENKQTNKNSYYDMLNINKLFFLFLGFFFFSHCFSTMTIFC